MMAQVSQDGIREKVSTLKIAPYVSGFWDQIYQSCISLVLWLVFAGCFWKTLQCSVSVLLNYILISSMSYVGLELL